MKDAHWQTAFLAQLQVDTQQRHWLFDQSSLTDKLVKKSKADFCVEVLQQGIAKPFLSEALHLNIAQNRSALIRQVVLIGKDIPWVYARTVIPLTSLHGEVNRLRFLGNASLGSALFASPNVKRGTIQVAHIGEGYLPKNKLLKNSQATWGRRSIFSLQNKPLLVTEVFLTALWSH